MTAVVFVWPVVVSSHHASRIGGQVRPDRSRLRRARRATGAGRQAPGATAAAVRHGVFSERLICPRADGVTRLGIWTNLALDIVRIFNLHGDEWDGAKERRGWRSKYARVGARVGAELIGGSMYELEPGDRLWPYHTHHANEEWLLVVRGTPTLRTPEGEQELSEGDVVCFRRGKDGCAPAQQPHRVADPRPDALDAPRARTSSSIPTAARSASTTPPARGSSWAGRGPTSTTGTGRTSCRPEDVVPVERVLALDRGLAAEAAVWSSSIVEVEPAGQCSASFVAVAVDRAVGPAAEQGADEAFGFPVRARPVWTGAQMLDPERLARERVHDRDKVGGSRSPSSAARPGSRRRRSGRRRGAGSRLR